MRLLKTLAFVPIAALLASTAWSVERITSDIAVPFVQERTLGQVCPPVSDSTRSVVQRYLDGGLFQVIEPEKLSLAFDLPMLTSDDFEPLTDRNDVENCKELNEHFGHLLHIAVKVPTSTGVETRNHYELTYFRARHHGMYIVAIYGPVIQWRDEQTRTRGVIRPPGPATTVLFFDSHMKRIRVQDVHEKTMRLRD